MVENKISLQEEMERIYSVKSDPWNYKKLNRHEITLGVCQDFWEGGTIVEIGCGEGILLSKLEGRLRPGRANIRGYDISELAVSRANDKLWSGAAVLLDIRKVIPPIHGTDLILISDVLPYIPEESDFVVSALFDRLRVGGHLVMTSWLDGHGKGNCFGVVPKNGSIECEVSWSGWALDMEDRKYSTRAEYRVLKKNHD